MATSRVLSVANVSTLSETVLNIVLSERLNTLSVAGLNTLSVNAGFSTLRELFESFMILVILELIAFVNWVHRLWVHRLPIHHLGLLFLLVGRVPF